MAAVRSDNVSGRASKRRTKLEGSACPRPGIPLSWIDSRGGLEGPGAGVESSGAMGSRLASTGQAIPAGFTPGELPGLRSFRDEHPLHWAWDRLYYGLAGRLVGLPPMYVRLDPWDRPLAGAFNDPEACAAMESAMPKRFRLIVAMMRWGGLRWEELAALRRGCCKPGRVRIVADGDIGWEGGCEVRALRYRATHFLESGMAEDLAEHLADFVGPGRKALVFTHEDGEGLNLGRFQEEVWTPALEAVGLSVELDPIDLTVCWEREGGA